MCSLRRVAPVLVLINDGLLAMRHRKSEKASIGWWTFYLLANTFFLYHHLAWLKKISSWNSLCSKDKNSSCSSGHVLRPQLVPHILNRRGEKLLRTLFSCTMCYVAFQKDHELKATCVQYIPMPKTEKWKQKEYCFCHTTPRMHSAGLACSQDSHKYSMGSSRNSNICVLFLPSAIYSDSCLIWNLWEYSTHKCIIMVMTQQICVKCLRKYITHRMAIMSWMINSSILIMLTTSLILYLIIYIT